MATETIDWDQRVPAECRGGAVAIGNFDGVHRGHLALVSKLREQARKCGGPAVVITFDPHPLKLLRPAQFQPVLTTTNERADVLIGNGADHVVILRTTPELLGLSAADFFQSVVIDRLGARSVVEGVNFGFGRNREGNIDTLTALCRTAGIDLVVVPPVRWKETVVSSSRVRAALLKGEVRQAADLLGRLYRLKGTVATGAGRGRQIGFPTANLEGLENLVPGDGVYAVRVRIGRAMWPGAANIGANPTFGENARKVEVHVIGFEGQLLGQELGLDFVERLRDTKPFAGVPQLVEQLRLDVQRARELAGPPA
jgi:riboflavin kinase/FMN adenylyltransferase